MKKFITLIIVSLMLLPAIGKEYEMRVDSVAGRDGRVVRRYRYNFKDEATYRAPKESAQTEQTPRYVSPRYHGRDYGYGRDYGRNGRLSVFPYYPGLNYGRYNTMPYYYADWQRRQNDAESQRMRNYRERSRR